MSNRCECNTPPPNAKFDLIAGGGIQNVSAFLPLLGTSQCQIHTLSALNKGFLYVAAAPMTMFGSLGVVKAAFVTLWASLHLARFSGPSQLVDAGFELHGVSSVLLPATDQSKELSTAERKIWEILRSDTQFTKVDVNFSQRDWMAWNLKMSVATLVLGLLGFLPFIYINERDTTARTFRGTWMYPLFRVVGNIISGITIQLLLQLIVLEHIYTRIRFIALDNYFKSKKGVVPGTWDPERRASMTLAQLEKEVDDQRCIINEPDKKSKNGNLAKDPPESQDIPLEVLRDPNNQLGIKLNPNDPMLQSLSAVVSFGKHQNPKGSRLLRFLGPSFLKILIFFFWGVLFIGLGAGIVGYVGCFSIIQSSDTTNGPLSWLLCEIALCGIRMVIWAWNPKWDDPEPPIAIEVSSKATYRIGWKLDDGTARDMRALIVGIGEFPSSEEPQPLKSAVSDAEKMKGYLRETLAVPDDNITLLTNENATKSAIMDAFDRLVQDSSIRLGAPILIYFATHAGRFESKQGPSDHPKPPISLAAYDLNESNRGQGQVPFGEIVTKLTQLASRRTDHIVVIFDTCDAGALARKPSRGDSIEGVLAQGSQALSNGGNAEVPIARSPARPVVAKSSEPTIFSEAMFLVGHTSHVFLGGSDEGYPAMESGKGGLFTDALLKSLGEAEGKKTSYADLHRDLEQRMSDRLKCKGVEQRPVCAGMYQNRLIFNGLLARKKNSNGQSSSSLITVRFRDDQPRATA